MKKGREENGEDDLDKGRGNTRRYEQEKHVQKVEQKQKKKSIKEVL